MADNTHLDVEMSQLFKLLGDKNRIRILLLLQSKKELNVTSIVENLDLEQSAVSHQLKLLKSHHLIRGRREGKSIYYALDDDHVSYLLSITKEHLAHSKG